MLIDRGLNAFRMQRVGVADVFVEHGDQATLRARYGVDAAAVVDAARRLMADG
jgi:transketolase C-terminal domain/subunit